MKYCKKCTALVQEDNTTGICFKCHIKPEPQWSQEAKQLIEWSYWYINRLTITKDLPFYVNLKKEIEKGADSPQARSGELIAKLKKMKQLVETEIIAHPTAYENFRN